MHGVGLPPNISHNCKMTETHTKPITTVIMNETHTKLITPRYYDRNSYEAYTPPVILSETQAKPE